MKPLKNTNVFSACGLFLDKAKNLSVKQIPFTENVRSEIEKTLKRQLDIFMKYESTTEFDRHYKADENECLFINNFVDTKECFALFEKQLVGEDRDSIGSVEELYNCHAIFFHIPSCPNIVLIQKFTKSLVANKGRFFGLIGSSKFGRLSNSSFSLGSSLVGIYLCAEDRLYFKNTLSIQQAIPGFDEEYNPGATPEMMKAFFDNAIFDKKASKLTIDKNSKTIKKLVWSINAEGVDLSKKLEEVKDYNEALNIKCIENDKIVMPQDVQKAKIILRIFLGDIFKIEDKIFMRNSKTALTRFAD